MNETIIKELEVLNQIRNNMYQREQEMATTRTKVIGEMQNRYSSLLIEMFQNVSWIYQPTAVNLTGAFLACEDQTLVKQIKIIQEKIGLNYGVLSPSISFSLYWRTGNPEMFARITSPDANLLGKFAKEHNLKVDFTSKVEELKRELSVFGVFL